MALDPSMLALADAEALESWVSRGWSCSIEVVRLNGVIIKYVIDVASMHGHSARRTIVTSEVLDMDVLLDDHLNKTIAEAQARRAARG